MASGIDGAAQLRKMDRDFKKEILHLPELLRIVIYEPFQWFSSESRQRIYEQHHNLINFSCEKLNELNALPEVAAAVHAINARWVDGYRNWSERKDTSTEAAYLAIEQHLADEATQTSGEECDWEVE